VVVSAVASDAETFNPFKASCGHAGGAWSALGLAALVLLRRRRRGGAAIAAALAIGLPAVASAADPAPPEPRWQVPTAPPAASPAKPASAKKAPKQLKVVIVPMTAGLGIPATLADAMTSVVVTELTARGIAAVTPRDVETALLVEKQKQMMGCTEEKCLTDLAGALGTDLIVSGSLTSIGKLKVITVQLFNARTGLVERTFNEQLSNAESEDLLDAAERAGQELFPQTRRTGTGTQRRTMLAAAPTRPLALEAAGLYEPTGPGGLAQLLLTWRLDAGLRLSAGGLLSGRQEPGAAIKASWAPFERWRFRPYVAVEGLALFTKDTVFGASAALGLELRLTERATIAAELPALWLLSAPTEYKSAYLMPGLTFGFAL
jgi:hypothetical protein